MTDTYFVNASNVVPSATLTIKPGLTGLWEINNIYYGGTVDLVRASAAAGILDTTFVTTIDPGSTMNLTMKVTYYNYIEIVNEDAVTISVIYDGKVVV